MDMSGELSFDPYAAAADREEDAPGVPQIQTIPVDKYYSYEDLSSKPFITPDSNIPTDLLQLTHSFGYDCCRRDNLQLLDEQTLAFVAGNVLVLLDIRSKEQRYLRSCSGGGIGTVMAHPCKKYFAVAEKGEQPNIIIYEFPSLRPYRILRGGTVRGYSSVDFNQDGTLLASVGSAPDFMLTLWDWVQEQVLLRYKAFSQDVYRVTFSAYNPGQLTTSGSGHIKFWKMAKTFTGLKLQGLLGRFGTALTDIDGYVELPDGKVVSGSEWGNMLLWEGGLIKVEISRKRGRPCHAGSIQQFALDEGELITIGADGAVRTWDVEGIDAADSPDDGGLFEMEPMNELLIGRSVHLASMVKSSLPDSFIWFAQDANGSIWKLDLSFSNMTHDPERLFAFHTGAIQAMDVSTTSHLMATTALDRSVRIFDFLAKRELTTSQYSQGGTALIWAPRSINPRGAVLVVGFEDGVVRLLELHRSISPQAALDQSQAKDAELRLIQALKPHNAPVTAIAYEYNGEILATGSADHTVFFFAVGDKCNPIGFITVPGPVKSLEWSPKTHERTMLLILCHNGYVIEAEAPEADSHMPSSTYEISGLQSRCFHFRSIKSRIKREMEVARRTELKDKRRKENEQRKKERAQEVNEGEVKEKEEEEEEEEEEELPPLYIPQSPSPLLCAFYSKPGAFWVSAAGYDAGFLYHCKFSEQQDEAPELRQDEPFAFLPLQETDQDPVCTVSFSSCRKFFLCGMWSGQIRVYPLQPLDQDMMSLDAFWAISLHDNQNGHLRSVRWSYDDQFVLTTGEDGNIFVFRLLAGSEEAQAPEPGQAKIPSPPFGIEMEKVVPDILEASAYSIETAKQRTELDRMRREAEQRKEERRKKLTELQSQFKELLKSNQSLPEHIRLRPKELYPRFREEADHQTAQKMREVQKELAWEAEWHSVALKKLQERFWESLGSAIITVVACQSGHKISTYRMLPPTQRFLQLQKAGQLGGPRQCKKEPSKESDVSSGAPVGTSEREENPREDEVFSEGEYQGRLGVPEGMGSHVTVRLQKAAEKAEIMKAKIERRKQEWVDLFASKPNENYEDPADVRALQLAIENVGDFKLKTAEDFTVPEQLRMNTERKKSQLVTLEEEIQERKLKMNVRIVALREEKMQLISEMGQKMEQLSAIQAQLATGMRRPCPVLPVLQPDEVPERRLQYTSRTLQRFAALRAQQDQRGDTEQGPEEPSLLSLMQEDNDEPALPSPAPSRESTPRPQELTELEQEVKQAQELRFLCQQDELLSQMEEAMWCFDAELQILRHEKEALDVEMKLADLRHVTLFQELLLLKDFEKRENLLQERLNARMQEESQILAKLEDCKKQLEFKQQSMVKLQQRERALHASFQASLGDNNKFTEFLTRVFKKKVKRAKKREKAGDEEEQDDSDEDSDEESDWDEMESDEESESGCPLDDSVCPPNCDPEMFENTLELRTRKLDLEELISEEKKSCEALKKECDALAKKEKIVQSSLKAAEGDLELFDREKQQKLNELDVVVPLRLHQIEFLTSGVLPSNLSDSLVLNTQTLLSLQDRIRQLLVEKNEQRELYRQARHRHYQLIHDHKDMETKIHELEERCEAMMMAKFGRLVDLEALQTLSGNRVVEELKHNSRVKEFQHTNELKLWKGNLTEVKQTLMEVSRQHTERVCTLNCLLKEKKSLEDQLDARQRKMGAQFRDHRHEQVERQRLQTVVASQAEKMATLRGEIAMLSTKGGLVLPPTQPLPSPDYNNGCYPYLRSGGASCCLPSSQQGQV